MNLNLTGVHLDITPAIREYVITKLDRINRHFDHVIDVNVVLSVDTKGNIYWYDARMPNTDALVARLKEVSKKDPQPEVHVRGDLSSPYEGVGKILLACQRAGITKVAFITEPPPLGG